MGNHISIMLIITHISFFFLITTCHSQPQQQPQPVYNFSSCKDIKNSYNCGNISNISYPFWGQNRPFQCGAGNPFYLDCHKNNNTTILLSSQNFTVLDINSKNHIIKLKRTDLDQNLCSPQFNDTYLSPLVFQYLPNVKNITIYYNCTSTVGQNSPTKSLCESPNHAFYIVGNELEGSKNCKRHIQVPVGADFPVKNDYYVYFERDVLESGLEKGFEVNYSVKEECSSCLGSAEGDCRWKNNGDIEKILQFSCYYDSCSDGSIASPTQCSSHHKSPWNSKSKLRIGVASAVLGLLAVITALYFYKHRRNISYAMSYVQSHCLSFVQPSKDLERESQHFPQSQHDGVQHFTYSELEEATNYFDPSKELGEGGFGTVYLGKLHDGRSVAVKRLYENNSKRVAQFMNEVEILARLVHPNLVSLYGCSSLHSRELLLAYEYVSNGTVADHLHGKNAKHRKLSWHIRMNIAVEAASALKYLHDSDIIHRDIKTNNILLDTHFRVKVADFGLSLLFPNDHSHVSTAPQGTVGYLDPEYIRFFQVTRKSDVYSFGVVMMELISSLPVVDITRHRDDINLSTMAMNKIQNQALHELVDPTLSYDSDSKVKEMISDVGELAFRCLQSSKDMRPCMDKVYKTLQDIQGAAENESHNKVGGISNSEMSYYNPHPLSTDSNDVIYYTAPNSSS